MFAHFHRTYLSVPKGDVDRYGFFEQQLTGSGYLVFDQTISGQSVKFICTNFDGGATTHGSYVKINGTVVASDWTIAPDETDNSVGGGVGVRMTRGHTIVVANPSGVLQGIAVYDTYGDNTQCNLMAATLQILPTGYLVAIGTYDATACTQSLRDAFINYFGDTYASGMTNPSVTPSLTWPSIRRSQLFLGKRQSTNPVTQKSLSITGDGGNRGYVDVGGARANWGLGLSYTIEFWSKAAIASAGSPLTVMSQQPNYSTIDIFYQNGKLIVNNGRELCNEPTVGVWTHVAIVCSGGGASDLKVYYNGVNVYTGAGYNVNDTSNDLWIGRRGNNDFQYFNGNLTNIRINTGAKYTGAFTPPTIMMIESSTQLALDGNLVDRSLDGNLITRDVSAHTITNTNASISTDVPT